jgi:GntR family transcriptional repressor for pyruvate dehydrogenase complex
MLEARGVIEVSHGRRPIVAHPSAQPLRDFFTLSVRRDARGMLDLLELRVGVEIYAAELAASNATRSDLDTMATALDVMRAADPKTTDGLTLFAQADLRFHAAVASASGNRLISFMVEGMEEPLRRTRMTTTHGHLARSNGMDDLITAHQAIFSAIKAHNVAAAASAMQTHLEETRKDLSAAITQGALPNK